MGTATNMESAPSAEKKEKTPDKSDEDTWNLPVIKNWLKLLNDQKPSGAFECVLYTDAHITGQVEEECGPYQFLNTVPHTGKFGTILPYIVLRSYYSEWGKDEPPKAIDKTDSSKYHGGSSIIDEISALSSLFLGARIKASAVTRDFDDLEKEPMGRPRNWFYRYPPSSLNFDIRGPVIPFVLETRNLSELHGLKDILELNGEEAIALLRAARLYQDALWIAETDPNLAWLMLVSALETVAGCWRGSSFSNKEILSETLPKLISFLTAEGYEKLIDWIADHLAHLTGSTKKFINFSLRFLPDAPEQRPREFLQIEWTPDAWKKTFSKIYKYRSEALHTGTPFPLPMGDPPFRYRPNEPLSERGTIGVAASQANASWKAEDLPINLNLFAIVTRQILLNWLTFVADDRRKET